uniref:Uncharacterized protein n=1 Tax=Noctiluca scintillans TaxID=2966 RepID=A0A7S1ARE8_NOCSC|mmetsp:Transcript_55374/g.147843  ORF Transcript_55374/g.147843 Transcript_55374/m.147843 type:complete len:282 (+) Transcript_55374:43-888(+)
MAKVRAFQFTIIVLLGVVGGSNPSPSPSPGPSHSTTTSTSTTTVAVSTTLALTTENALKDLTVLTAMTGGEDGGMCTKSEVSSFPFSATYSFSGVSTSNVLDIVKKTVALVSDTNVSCVNTSRRLQESTSTVGSLSGTIEGTCSSFSTADDAISLALTSIAGLGSGSVSTTGGCTTTTHTTTDGGGWPWWAWFLLVLVLCCVFVFLACLLGVVPSMLGKWENMENKANASSERIMPRPVTTVPMARPVTMVPMAGPATTVPMASTNWTQGRPVSIVPRRPP